MGGELQGRVVDRGTLAADGQARGVGGVKVSVFDGKKLIASAVTNPRGHYRIKRVAAQRVRVTFRAGGYLPSPATRFYAISDTGDKDVYLDAGHIREGVPTLGRDAKEKRAASKGKRGKDKDKDKDKVKDLGYYQGLARGIRTLPALTAFFNEDQGESFAHLGAAFDGGDSTADYLGVMVELLWGEYLAQDRPVETRVYLAHALSPILDSLAWGPGIGMDRYLDADPEAVEEMSGDIRAAVFDAKRMPAPQEIRKARVTLPIAGEMVSQYLASNALPAKARRRFLVKLEKSWGKDLIDKYVERRPEAPEEFKPAVMAEKVAALKGQSPVAQYLRGLAHFSNKDYAKAAEACGLANRLRAGYPAARYLEAMAYSQLGRTQEALGRFQALCESPDPAWKAKGYYGVGLMEEKEGRWSQAAADLWKSLKLHPDPEVIYLMARISLKLTNNDEAEKYLEGMLAKDDRDHQAHFWLGKYAELRHQSGVAEEHFRKAWEISPAPEYGEALAHLFQSREEYAMALGILQPMRGRLTPEGRALYAECLLQAGRAEDARREYAAVYAPKSGAALMARYVDALLQLNRTKEAMEILAAYPGNHPVARMALAKAHLRANETGKARLILDELAKGDEGNAEIHFLLGQTLYQERAFSKAKREFDLALQYRQDYTEAVYFTGMSLLKDGKGESAKDYFNELSQRAAADWRAKGFLGLAMIFAAQQKTEAAENFYEKSLAAHETAEAAALLALSRRRLGDPDQWEPQAKKAYALDSRNSKAVQAMGESMLARGRKTQALQLFQKALAASPNSCDLLPGLAKSQFLSGQYQASRTTSASAISQCPDEADAYYYAAVTSDKLQNRKEAMDYFKAYRRAGGDEGLLPQEYR